MMDCDSKASKDVEFLPCSLDFSFWEKLASPHLPVTQGGILMLSELLGHGEVCYNWERLVKDDIRPGPEEILLLDWVENTQCRER